MSMVDCAQFLLLALLLIAFALTAFWQARLRREIARAERLRADETKRLQEALQELQEQLDHMQQDLRTALDQTEELRRLTSPQEEAAPEQESWEALIHQAMGGDESSVLRLRQRIMQDRSVHIVDFADQYRHLNDHLYAEFSDRSSGGCLLIPTDTASDQHLAYPLPTGGDWFPRHRDLITTVFDVPSDPLHGSAAMSVAKPATLRVKKSGGRKPTVYEIVEKGTLSC